jgi:hypothetical protein
LKDGIYWTCERLKLAADDGSPPEGRLYRKSKDMKGTFVAYIDEAGDEGFRFGKGSSEWFVLAAAITLKQIDLRTVQLVDRVRAELKIEPKKPLHFRDLKHEKRLVFIDEIANARVHTISVLIKKSLLAEPEKFRLSNRLYFYATRLLFERISWYCEETRLPTWDGDGSVEIVFSNRSGMSYKEMCEYMELLKETSAVRDVQIRWSVIRHEQIKAFSPPKRMGLLIADAVAGSFYEAVEPNAHGFTEDRYARMLKPVVYRRNGRYQGYGIKLWPSKEINELLKTDAHLQWIVHEYS